MSAIFGDTFYFVANLNRRDQHHSRVVADTTTRNRLVITTRWVLAEVANALADTHCRQSVAVFLENVEGDPEVFVVVPSDEVYERGVKLYADRPDKEWSLTDCISFAVMTDEGIYEALTGDHHFEQAGFTAIFAD